LPHLQRICQLSLYI